jgi:hypothetical protein
MKLWGCFRDSAKAPKHSAFHVNRLFVQLEGRQIWPLLWPHWSNSPALRTKYCQVSDKSYQSIFLLYGAAAPSGPGLSHFGGFMITLRHTTFGRIPQDEWSERRRDLYLTTHNYNKRQTSMALARFEPTVPARERSQTHTLDRMVTETG